MIACTWHGAVPIEKADAHHDYLLETGVSDYRKTPGNRGIYVLRRTEGKTAHFLLLTLWDSLDAIRAFAGDDIERAVLPGGRGVSDRAGADGDTL